MIVTTFQSSHLTVAIASQHVGTIFLAVPFAPQLCSEFRQCTVGVYLDLCVAIPHVYGISRW